MAKKIKLCLLTDNFPPAIGGATYLFLLSRHLIKKNYQISIITGSVDIEKEKKFDRQNPIQFIGCLN
jgi:hypothetical protein